jgi:predicted ATPase/DNA-binding SARP family transcriptional activator/class 3 adenylate cyclase
MEFRILGALEVCSDSGRTLDLAGKQRALLAVLLLHPDEAVSTDRLIDALWGAEPPETAGKALQVYVSRLRKLFGREGKALLVTRPPGYALDLTGHELDLRRFERLRADATRATTDGDAATAEAKLREALSLWRGPPLADFTFEPFAQNEIARLEELHLTALEERVDALLALGRHPDIVGELETLVAEHPLRERLRAQLMLALYRSRRQAEALEAYQAARRALVDELGIEPSPELQELERRILRQDVSLEVATPAPPTEEPTPSPATAPGRRAAGMFVGRERELDTLEAGFEDALAGRGRLFLLVGEPGIGKSRLADEFASRAKQRGANVLWGRCWEAGGASAYWPWVQSLRSLFRTRDRDELRAWLGGRAPELAQLLPEVDDLVPDLPAPRTLDPDSARFRLFDSVAGFLRDAARGQTLVLILDDLHAADEPSLLLLRFLAGELAEMGVIVVGTYRETEAVGNEPVSASLSELSRLPSHQLRLGGLSEVDVASFIELSTGVGPHERLVNAVHAETEGNPLFVGEVVRLLASEGRLTETPEVGWNLQIPPGVHEAIAQRLRRLSKDCRRLLTLAAVLGREFSLEALEQVSALPEDELLEGLDEAFAARLLAEVPGAPERMRFSHARVRDVLYNDLSTARRAQLHLRIGEALEGLYGADSEPYLAELAHHFFRAGPGGDVEKTVEYTRRAGDRALALLAYEEAVRHYEMALRAVERRKAKGQEKCELYLALGDAHAKAGGMSEAKEAFVAAAELARAARHPEELARAALGYGGRFVWSRAFGDTRLLPLLEEALAALPKEDSELRARLLARLAAGPLRDTLPPAPRVEMAQAAVEMARRLGDPATLAYALEGRYETYWGPDALEERLAIANELILVAEDAGDAERAYAGHDCRFYVFLEAGDVPAAYRDHEVAARLAHELRQPAQLWATASRDANLALFEGRFAQAESAIHEALELGRLAQSANAQVAFDLQMYALRREQGRLEEMVDVVERAVGDYPAYPVWRFVRADVFTELDRTDDARAAFEACAADGFRLNLEEQWLYSMSLATEACRYLGDVERAAELYDLLRPYGQHNATVPTELCRGSVSRDLGALAAVRSNSEQAAQHFEDALEQNARMGARPWLTHTEHDYARLLLARDEPADSARAEELLGSAQMTCQDLGMTGLAAKVTALLDELTARPPRAERRPPDAKASPAIAAAGRETRKTVTALWVGLATASRGDVSDPEVLRRVMSDAFSGVQSAVERHGGSVRSIAGEALTAVFGVPAVHEDDSLRAVRAAVDAREALSDLAVERGGGRPKLEFRIGISTGRVVTGGAVGTDLRMAGEPLTLSSRLGQAAEAGEIVVDEATRALLRNGFVVEAVDGAWRVIQAADTAPGFARRLSSAMVGRERERRRLRDAFDQAVSDRSCQLFTVLGPAGVGKSRLVQEHLGDLGGQALVTRGRCIPYGEGITYWPLREAVKAAVGLEDTDTSDEALAKLAASVGEAENGDLVARQVAEMIGLDVGPGLEEAFTAVRALFEAWARSEPLVVVFEDIHWGEPAFLDLVEHIADWARDAPILLVCLARPELLDARPDWGGGKPNATSILLEALSEQESGQLIDNLAGEAPLHEATRRRIVEAAEGNPLFVEEMLALVLDDPGAEGELEVPAAINALLTARLDQLGDEVRSTIEAASVEGQVFHEGSVGELVPAALQRSVHAHLLTLIRTDLIRPERPEFSDERAFRFRHLLTREAAYESIPKGERARLHERHAAWLERKAGDRAGEYDEILGYHLEQACKCLAELGPPDGDTRELGARGASRLASAARRAVRLGDARAGANLLGRAAGLLPASDENRLQLLPDLGQALMESGEFEAADTVLHEAIAAAKQTGAARLEASAKLTQLLLRLRSSETEGWSEEAKAQLEHAIAVFESSGDHVGLAKAYRLLGWAHGTVYHFREVESAVTRGIEHARLAGHPREERATSTMYAMAGIFGPTPVLDAIARCEQVLEVTSESLVHQGIVTASLGLLEAMGGDFERARMFAGRARETLETLREGSVLTAIPAFLGRLELLAGDTKAAERELRREYEILEDMGERYYLSSVSALLAEALYEQGRLDEAERLTATAEKLAAKDDVEAQMLWRCVRAKVLTRKADIAAAEALAREAVRLARTTDSELAQGNALEALAEALQGEGRQSQAAAALEEAIRLYELKGSVVSAAGARARIEQLAGSLA